MSDADNFDSNYLTSLLHSSPATVEELEQTRQKISFYFRSLEKTQKRQISETSKIGPNQKNHGQLKTTSAQPAKKNVGANKQLSDEAGYRARYALMLTIMIGPIVMLLLCKAFHLNWLPLVILFGFGLYIWSKREQYFRKLTGLEDPELQKLALGKLVPSAGQDKISHWARRCGEGEVSIFRDKWNDLNKSINQILLCTQFDTTLPVAEHCLSILDYFDDVRYGEGKTKSQESRITDQPVNRDSFTALIDRLIDDHELDFADKLSQHYIEMRSPSFQ